MKHANVDNEFQQETVCCGQTCCNALYCLVEQQLSGIMLIVTCVRQSCSVDECKKCIQVSWFRLVPTICGLDDRVKSTTD